MTLRRKLAWVSALYFAEGLPFGIVVDNLPVYFRVHGVSLGDIGLTSLLRLPWSLKILWAPIVDISGSLRRWIASALFTMAGVMLVVPFLDAARVSGRLWALLFGLTIASATQDIAIDAYTIGLMERGEEGMANGVRVSAYRVALIVAGGGLLALSRILGWVFVFHSLAGIFLVLAAVALRVPATAAEAAARPAWLPTLRAWLAKPGALGVFLFVLTYKLGDASMGPMVKPFWVDRGLTVEEIGLVSTTGGVALSVAGALVGGAFTSRYGIFRGLWALGLAQAFSNLGYAAAAHAGAGRLGIYAASMLESFTGGLGTAAFLSFLMRACDKEQAATQYALLSALFAVAGSLAGSFGGFAVERWGYADFFALTFLLSFPAYVFLPSVRVWVGEIDLPTPRSSAS